MSMRQYQLYFKKISQGHIFPFHISQRVRVQFKKKRQNDRLLQDFTDYQLIINPTQVVWVMLSVRDLCTNWTQQWDKDQKTLPGQQPELDSTTPSLQCALLHCNVLQHPDSWLVLLPWRQAAAATTCPLYLAEEPVPFWWVRRLHFLRRVGMLELQKGARGLGP